MANNILLNKLIPNKLIPFVDMWFNGESIEFVIKGGRASSKTRIACYLCILAVYFGMGNVACVRRYYNTLEKSCYNELRNVIHFLGLDKEFKFTKRPLQILCTRNGYAIEFIGLDDPENKKGFTFQNGQGCYAVWYEECNTMQSYSDIRSIHQTFGRKADDGVCRALLTYNPPNSKTAWANNELNHNVTHPYNPNMMYRIVEHINYLDIPKEWLSEAFFVQAEVLKRVNYDAYAHEYLGEVRCSGGNLFPNVHMLLPHMMDNIDYSYVHRGVDFGIRDAMVGVCGVYDKKTNSIYIFDAFYKRGSSYNELSNWLKSVNKYGNTVFCDCADTGGIKQLRDNGCKGVVACKKPHDCIKLGINWLQHLDNIYIAPELKEIYKLMSECQYMQEKDGSYTNEYPKSTDPCWDAIDAIRYTFEKVIFNRV